MKKNLIALVTVTMLGMSASAFAAPGDVINTFTQSVSSSLNTTTCSVTFPTDVTLPVVTTADYQAATQYGVIGNSSVSAGSITFSGCDTQQVKVVIDSTNSKTSNGLFAFPTLNGTSQSVIGFAIKEGLTNSYVKVNGQEDSKLVKTISGDSFEIPVTIESIRASGASLTAGASGALNASFVYTATYQ
ncbi:type 1 fimbrial protein [Escherichia coli]|nr:type 1 fimbrial protein [Escherichia coli]